MFGAARACTIVGGNAAKLDWQQSMATDPQSDPPLNGGDAGASSDKTMRIQQLFVKHQLGLRAFILSLEPNFTDAEDLLQEVFLVVTRKAAEFEEGTNFFAWAC